MTKFQSPPVAVVATATVQEDRNPPAPGPVNGIYYKDTGDGTLYRRGEDDQLVTARSRKLIDPDVVALEQVLKVSGFLAPQSVSLSIDASGGLKCELGNRLIDPQAAVHALVGVYNEKLIQEIFGDIAHVRPSKVLDHKVTREEKGLLIKNIEELRTALWTYILKTKPEGSLVGQNYPPEIREYERRVHPPDRIATSLTFEEAKYELLYRMFQDLDRFAQSKDSELVINPGSYNINAEKSVPKYFPALLAGNIRFTFIKLEGQKGFLLKASESVADFLAAQLQTPSAYTVNFRADMEPLSKNGAACVDVGALAKALQEKNGSHVVVSPDLRTLIVHFNKNRFEISISLGIWQAVTHEGRLISLGQPNNQPFFGKTASTLCSINFGIRLGPGNILTNDEQVSDAVELAQTIRKCLAATSGSTGSEILETQRRFRRDLDRYPQDKVGLMLLQVIGEKIAKEFPAESHIMKKVSEPLKRLNELLFDVGETPLDLQAEIFSINKAFLELIAKDHLKDHPRPLERAIKERFQNEKEFDVKQWSLDLFKAYRSHADELRHQPQAADTIYEETKKKIEEIWDRLPKSS